MEAQAERRYRWIPQDVFGPVPVDGVPQHSSSFTLRPGNLPLLDICQAVDVEDDVKMYIQYEGM